MKTERILHLGTCSLIYIRNDLDKPTFLKIYDGGVLVSTVDVLPDARLAFQSLPMHFEYQLRVKSDQKVEMDYNPHTGSLYITAEGKQRKTKEYIIVAGEPAHERLMKQIKHERRRIDAPIPSSRQVAMVLHALADHTAIMQMLEHRPDLTSPWPKATSIGRWFHDVGDALEDES